MRAYFERAAITAHSVNAYLLRVCIGVDALSNAITNHGTLGVTISARAGTAAAHGHRWGLTLWWILDRCWPFGRNKITGESHCKAAIRNDKLRSQAVMDELNDPVVLAYVNSPTCGDIDICVVWPRLNTWRNTWHSIARVLTANLSAGAATTSTSKTASTSTSTETK